MRGCDARALAAAMLALLAGCGSGAAPAGNREEAAPPPFNVVAPAANQAIAKPAPDQSADLAGMSPRQRRAYEAGFADCRAGRYAPDNHPEAYRIGCAAAHDR